MTVVAITGSSGLVGRALMDALRARGDSVRAVRRDGRGGFETAELEGADAVVHLAGEPLADGRWTPARKRVIEASRGEGTRRLVESVRALSHKPAVWVSASAIGIYGSRGDEVLSEQSVPGIPGPTGAAFLARVCAGWEHETEPLGALGVRTCVLRLGLVLSTQGGALAKMLPLFRAGAGGPLGHGRQWWSWVSLADVTRATLFALDTASFSGVANVVSPDPKTCAEFVATLGRVLHRPALLRVPDLALRLALGEMAEATVLASQRVVPSALLSAGFNFHQATLASALEFELRSGNRA